MGYPFEFWFLLSGVLPSLGMLALVFVVVILATASRDAPDPAHQRPAALYFAGVRFVALFVALAAGFFAISSLVNVPIEEPQPPEEYRVGLERTSKGEGYFAYAPNTGMISDGPIGPRPDVLLGSSDDRDRELTDFFKGLAVALLAFGVFVFHMRRVRELELAEGDAAWRIQRGYRYTVAFTGALVALGAASAALFGLIDAIAPDATGSGPRSQGVAQFVSAAILAAAAGLIVAMHLVPSEAEFGDLDDDDEEDDDGDDLAELEDEP